MKTIIHQLSLTNIGGIQKSFVPYFLKSKKKSNFKHLIYGAHKLDEYYNEISPFYTCINDSLINRLKFIYFIVSNNYIIHFYNKLGSKAIYTLLKIIPSTNIVFHERGAAWNAQKKDRKIFLSNSLKSKIIIANSNASKIMLIKKFGINKNKIKVIYNGFLQKDQKFNPKNVNRYTKNYCIGYIGRLDTPKGVHILIEAAKKLPNYDFYIAGSGAWEKTLKKKSYMNKNIYFVGRVKEPLNFISKMDLIVVPSVREPFGNIIVEAGFCKKPVIASNIDGIPEIIQDNVSGLLITPTNKLSFKKLPKNAVPIPNTIVNPLTGNLEKPKEINVSQLCEAIKKIENNRALGKKFGLQLNINIIKNFTLENYMKNLETLYTKLSKQ